MITFKCKMCGGDLEFEQGATVTECPYCGSRQTLPRLDNNKRANMYDRANHFRRQNEYDKAMGIYEQILQEDRTDAEAYWSLVLCRYGIEYVEDPATHKRVPTVNRMQYASILTDEDYQSALEYADTVQKSVYETEAAAIAEIQKGILEISKQEKPFDVFICYKETDTNGRRTPDSVLATDLYHQLTKEGFKVFFSRITLEDKIGSAYEPYIFAALNSARVMVVLGTKPEYFNAVWVKNEWSRYLALIRAGADKTLVPAYRDMDPYDLPDEFAHLQAQDMGKLGFMQDLIRGIQKITGNKESVQQKRVETSVLGGVTTESLMKRVRLFIEDSDFSSAGDYIEKVLDIDPEFSPAYVGKVLVEYKLHSEDELRSLTAEFEKNSYWQKAIRFANPAQKEQYNGYVRDAVAYRQEKKSQDIYYKGVQLFHDAESEEDCIHAAELFDKIIGYMDANELSCKAKNKAVELAERAKQRRIERIIETADGLLQNATTIEECEQAREMYSSIADSVDIQERIQKAHEKAEKIALDNAKREELMKEKIVGLQADFKIAQEHYERLQEEKRKARETLSSCIRNKTEAEKRLEIFSKELENLKGVFNGKRKSELQSILALEPKNIETAKKSISEAERKIREIDARPAFDKPNPDELTYQIGNIYLNAGLVKDAVSEFEKIKGYGNVHDILQRITI